MTAHPKVRILVFIFGVAGSLTLGCEPDNRAAGTASPQRTTTVDPASQMGIPTGSIQLDGAKPVTDITARPRAQVLTTEGGLEVRRSALSSTPEVTILSDSTASFAETAAAFVQGSDGTAQELVTSNVMTAAGGSLSRADYGCFRGSSSSLQCDYVFNNSLALGDPGLVTGADGFVYMERLANPTGAVWLRSNNPCPSTCGAVPSWNQCNSTGYPIDYSMPIAADSSGHLWDVHNDWSSDPDHVDAITVGKLTFCSSISWFNRAAQCNGATHPMKSRSIPHAVLASNGMLHVVWLNETAQTIEHGKFNTITNSWDCAIHTVAFSRKSTTNCTGSTSTKVMPTIGNSNLEFDQGPRIALEPVSNVLIVSFDTYDAQEYQVAKVRTHVHISADSGATWSAPQLIAQEESAKGSVDVDGQGDTEIGDVYAEGGSNRAAQVAWISRQSGVGWAGQFISAYRTLAPLLVSGRSCFWGDYQAVRWHPNFQSGLGAFLHTWTDSSLGPRLVVRGTFVFN
jgi:hypothetical protein